MLVRARGGQSEPGLPPHSCTSPTQTRERRRWVHDLIDCTGGEFDTICSVDTGAAWSGERVLATTRLPCASCCLLLCAPIKELPKMRTMTLACAVALGSSGPLLAQSPADRAAIYGVLDTSQDAAVKQWSTYLWNRIETGSPSEAAAAFAFTDPALASPLFQPLRAAKKTLEGLEVAVESPCYWVATTPTGDVQGAQPPITQPTPPPLPPLPPAPPPPSQPGGGG
jgi:hypothetical protein